MSQTKQFHNIVVKQPIINPVENFYEISKKKKKLAQQIYLIIKILVENKSGSETNLDKMDKSPFDNVVDYAIKQLIVSIEHMKFL